MWTRPIVEIRTEEYTRGTLPRYLDAHRTYALPVLERHLARPMAYYTTTVGRINCITQLRGHESVAAWEEGRHGVENDPGWAAYRKATDGIVRFVDTRVTRQVVFPAAEAAAEASRAKPVIDFRIYQIHAGHMQTFIDTSEKFALKVMIRHIGPPLGYYRTIVGNTNEIIHLWGYDSLADMETRRHRRNADPEWPDYLNASDGIYHRQETQLMKRLDV
jgi:hypothetical protein